VAGHEVPLKAAIQALIDDVSEKTGFAIGVGLVDTFGNDFGIGAGSRTPPGLPPKARPGNLTALDTYVLGSGTKPYTSTCVLRLVDQGKVKLEDAASLHIDKFMRKMWNTTFVELLGPMAANVTVGHLIRMQSGLGEFDVPKYDDRMLNSTKAHNPLLDLQFLANLTGPFGCRDMSCTWVCAPGNCTSYASANFLLAGIVLLAHAPANQTSWQTYDHIPCLGHDFQRADLKHTHFPTIGPLPPQGLTTAGRSVRSFGSVEVYSQDASIMGFCYGNAVASPRDVARFLFELLGPRRKFISASSLAAMQKWSVLSTGWAAGKMNYGAGLEVRNVAKSHHIPPRLTELGTFVGHDGETFGFWSNQGWFPALNTSIALMTNQDHDTTVNYAVTCHIVKMIAKRRNLSVDDIRCGNPSGSSQMSRVFV